MPCKPQFRVPDPDGTYEDTHLHCDTWLIFTTRTKSAKLDLAADSRLFMKCQKLGIDIFSAATDVAFLMELYEKGHIPKKDAGMDIISGLSRSVCVQWVSDGQDIS